MDPFKDLAKQEYDELLKYPAYISILAAIIDEKLDEHDKKAAIKLAHIKSFSCNPLVVGFYKDADKVFKQNIEELDRDLPDDKESREVAILKQLARLDAIIQKLGPIYAPTLHSSLESFKEHVAKGHHSVLVDFVFPLPIKGLTDR